MSDFTKSLWTDPVFSREYLDNAEAYVPYRETMLSVLVSFYRHFLGGVSGKRILDLGSGDGIIAEALKSSDPDTSVTLVDGSEDMLARARNRFAGIEGTSFIRASFQQLMAEDVLLDQLFHLVVSSLAIHHLPSREKRDMYSYIIDHLLPGGYLLHLDTVLAPTNDLEDWSMALWQDWVDRKREAGQTDQDFSDITRRYQGNSDNQPDTLKFHLEALSDMGFTQIDCLFKYGTFAVWTGRKPV
jgi:tRNA (cmo5U34)-methyltransferase